MNKIYTKIALTSLILTPFVSFAAGKTLSDLVILTIGYFNQALVLIIGLAVVTFVWNVYKYFFTESDKAEAGKYVLFSVIGFFVILSFWGFVAILKNTLKLDDQRPNTIPSGFNFNSTTNTNTSLPNNSNPGNTNAPNNSNPGNTNAPVPYDSNTQL